MNELVIKKDKWAKMRNAVDGLLKQCELPVLRITLTEDAVSVFGLDGTQIGHVDISQDYSAPAWIQMRGGGSTSVHIEVFCD